MGDSRDKRPGTMSDEDRALEAMERRRRVQTPHAGVPIQDHDDDDFTPVGVAIERMEKAIDLTDRERELLRLAWEHSANQEMRTRKRVELTEGGQLRADIETVAEHVADVKEAIIDIHGASGQNGKLGELKRRVDGLTTRIWSAIGSAVASLGAAAVLIWNTSGDYHDVKAAARAANDQIKILQAQVMTLQAAAISRSSRRAGGLGATAEQPAAEPGKD